MPQGEPWTLSTKFWMLVAVLLLGAGIGFQVYDAVTKPGLGDPCVAQRDCGPDARCLRVSSFRPAPLDPNADEVTRQARSMASTLRDPLAADKGIRRKVPTREAYCTAACTRDEDCPDTMRCGEALSFPPDPSGDSQYVSGPGSPVRVCTRPEPTE